MVQAEAAAEEEQEVQAEAAAEAGQEAGQPEGPKLVLCRSEGYAPAPGTQCPDEIVLQGELLQVGRRPTCDVVLETPQQFVSRLHAVLIKNHNTGVWSVRDEGSTTGVYANSQRVKKKPLR